MKVLIHTLQIFAAVLIQLNVAHAGPTDPNKWGFIMNDSGDKCYYDQVLEQDNRYFNKRELSGEVVAVLVFQDKSCMVDRGLGLDINKKMINNIITRWYSHPDANFATSLKDMYPTSMLQLKGRCIQSRTYPNIGVKVDYLVQKGSVRKVVHGSSISGCTD